MRTRKTKRKPISKKQRTEPKPSQPLSKLVQRKLNEDYQPRKNNYYILYEPDIITIPLDQVQQYMERIGIVFSEVKKKRGDLKSTEAEAA